MMTPDEIEAQSRADNTRAREVLEAQRKLGVPLPRVGETFSVEPAPNSDEAHAAAQRVRELAARAAEAGRQSGTTKAAGPETPPGAAVGQKPRMLSIPSVVAAVDQLLRQIGESVDTCDGHFMQHPPAGRELTDEEVTMLLKRRHGITVMRQLRDACSAVYDACGEGPKPF